MWLLSRILLMVLLAVAAVGCGGPTEPDGVDDLLARHGWRSAGPRQTAAVQLPTDLRLKSGAFPWRVVVDLSRDVELDAESLAGQEVTMVSLPVRDVRGGRLEELKRHVDFRAYVLLDPLTGRPAAAYLVQTGKNGEMLDGGPGPSLSGRDLHEITGLSWPEYVQKYRAEQPSPATLEAEKQRNAIRAFFRAASAHDCEALRALVADGVDLCDRYESPAPIRVIEMLGYAKADTPQGFRYLSDSELADQFRVIIEVAGVPPTRQELLISVVRDDAGGWRLIAATIPSIN